MPSAAPTQVARDLLRGRVPLIDVRAPVEFANGAPATAVNLPILENVERAAVGSCYHAHGAATAFALGERLVAGRTRERRIERWVARLEQAPDSWVYCWRGGDRSGVAQQWLRAEAGIDVPRVAGGVKALRRAGIDALERAANEWHPRWLVVSGRTGSGKTDFLRGFDGRFLDLEHRANHRGSAFGELPGGQPTPIRFEFDLATDVLHLESSAVSGPVLIEDEGFSVGRVGVPESLVGVILNAAVIRLEVDLGTRVRNVHRDYVEAPLLAGFCPAGLEQQLLGAVDRIRRRLGAEQHGVVRREIEAAFGDREDEAACRAFEHHAGWIRRLLVRYYDPLYDRQMKKQDPRVVFRGDFAAATEWVRAAAEAQISSVVT